MNTSMLAQRLLIRETRGLLARLDQVQPFALNMPSVPAAAIPVEAQAAIERHMARIKQRLRTAIFVFLRWLRNPMAARKSDDAQRRYVLLKLQFNALITQFDIFADVLSQRSEHETGVWVAGLDDLAADAMRFPGMPFKPPPVVCYLDRGHGAAIRRLRTRLPGGDPNPVAVINVPRERMVGSGIASSLVHEVGHQVAALLDLSASLKPVLQRMQSIGPPDDKLAWFAWERWISEILADLWSVGKLGVGATTGLMAVVSLPRPFVFRLDMEDPHPFPWIRVKLSIAIGKTLYPGSQWDRLNAVWERLYPRAGLPAQILQWLRRLERVMPAFVSLLINHRPRSLRGRRLRDVLPTDERTPQKLRTWFSEHRAKWPRWLGTSPTGTMAVIGQARLDDRLNSTDERELMKRLLTTWSVRSALQRAQHCGTLSGPV